MRPTGVLRVALAVAACLAAAAVPAATLTTFGRRPQQQQQPEQQRGKSPARRVMEPAFENAGQQAGIEIWRIEDFKPVRYPKDQYGKFYSGDSYIVLSTQVNKRGEKFWDIHFWLGSETSQDEAGAAAILAVQLDDQLGGDPVQHREVQDHESQKFLSYFKNGVRYLPGGVSSGFTHVEPGAFEKRLFQVKGSRNIRVKQVVPNISSMNKGDCFILDSGRNIYVYVGAKARRVEKLKAIGAANQIRDQDHAGKAKVTIVDEFSSESEVNEFFTALGSGSAADVPEEAVGGDDRQFETSEERAVSLHKVSDASGQLKITPVATKPLEQSLLDPNDCFILDTGDSNIYVWVGKKSTAREKQDSLAKADKYLEEHKHPKWTHVERIVQGAEPTAFTQYFRTWQAAGELHPRLTRAASNENAPLELDPLLFHAKIRNPGEAFHIERIASFDQDDLDSGDVMFLDVGHTIYIWQGKEASDEEKEKSKELIDNYIKHNGREDVNVVVLEQGDEGEEFKSKFPSWNAELWDNQPDIRTFVKN